jgi:hypothetical protein
MKYVLLMPLAALLLSANCFAQPMYKCENNYYTNTLPDAKAKGCKLMEGGNVTVVPSVRPAPAALNRSGSASSGAQKVDANDQKARDSDARQILELELKKSEARQLELQKEYNNGEPERIGIEARNQQKYLVRIAELKAALARNESDIAGIRREIGRLVPGAPASAAK